MDRTPCDCLASKFDQAYADDKLRVYRASGPDPSTLALIEAIRAQPIEGMTLLDIGGGVGAIQHALLAAGISSVVEVEASAAYVAACQAEAERQGHSDRITHVQGEFGSLADQVPSADIVTLDRSLCCWPDMPELVSRSASKARHLYALVYPRDVWWVRYGWRLVSNVRQLLHRSPLRVFIHRTREVEAILTREGMVPHRSSSVGVWHVAVYRRAASAPAA